MMSIFRVYACVAGCYKFSRYKTGKLDKDMQQSASEQQQGKPAPVNQDEKPLLLVPEGANRWDLQ